MADVVVTELITGEALDALRRDLDVAVEVELWRSSERLREAVRDARALVVRNQTLVSADVIAAAPRLLVIARAGAGLDNIDTRAAAAAGVVVSYAPHENSVAVAELTLGLMLALARKVPAADRHVRAGGWDRHRFVGVELHGKTLGVVGLGRIGRLTAARARAFGMSVLAHDRFLDADSPAVRAVGARLVGLDELLAAADVVACHVPLSADTAGLFGYEQFCRMKPRALFVNTARGEVVNEEGLLRALREGRIGGAALDVRRAEPPGPGPLDSLDNVILTPHIAAFTAEAQERVVAAVCRDVRAVLGGGAAANAFDFASPRRPGDG